MGRHFDILSPDFLFDPPPQPPAIQIGGMGSLTFLNADNVSLAMAVGSPDQLFALAQPGQMYDLDVLPDCHYGVQLGYLRAVANITFIYAEAIQMAYEASTTQAVYEDTSLGCQLGLVPRLVKGGLGARVYMVELDGFDTHANHSDWHPLLLTDLAKSVRAFFDDLEAGDWHNKVLAVTHSEFGRRPKRTGPTAPTTVPPPPPAVRAGAWWVRPVGCSCQPRRARRCRQPEIPHRLSQCIRHHVGVLAVWAVRR